MGLRLEDMVYRTGYSRVYQYYLILTVVSIR